MEVTKEVLVGSGREDSQAELEGSVLLSLCEYTRDDLTWSSVI